MKTNPIDEVISSETFILLSLSMISGVGPVLLKNISKVVGLSELDITYIAMRFPKLQNILKDESLWLLAREKAERQVEAALKNSFRIISVMDKDYPPLLSETKDDPCILFVKGRLFHNISNSVAIIGTRAPTNHGGIIAKRITSFFVEEGWSIISGLAFGCDARAHETALNAKGHTVAVLAHGLHTILPKSNAYLAQKIIDSGGALITEYPFGHEMHISQYVKRDRIQAGLAQGVVMIQSDVKGGSLHASRAALDYNRWLAIPFPTSEDISKCEPKIQANIMLAEGRDDDRCKLLRCTESKLKNIIILRSKNDYKKIMHETLSPSINLNTHHQSTGDLFEDDIVNSEILDDLHESYLLDFELEKVLKHPPHSDSVKYVDFFDFDSEFNPTLLKKNLELKFNNNTEFNSSVLMRIELILDELKKINLLLQGTKENFGEFELFNIQVQFEFLFFQIHMLRQHELFSCGKEKPQMTNNYYLNFSVIVRNGDLYIIKGGEEFGVADYINKVFNSLLLPC